MDKKLLSTLLFLLFYNTSKLQNLIINGGFETIESCPTIGGQISLAKGWYSPTVGTPDLLASCSTNIDFGVPNNRIGLFIDFRNPYEGKNFAGINTYLAKEYMMTKLKQPLKPQKNYYLSMQVSFNLRYRLGLIYTDGIGLALSDTNINKISTNNLEPLRLKIIIDNKGKTIRDTVNWTKLSGCYKAKGTEEYAVIGNFKTDAETIIEKEDKDNNYIGKYFYIDDVRIEEYNPLPDTLILCAGIEQKINAAFYNSTYQWSTGKKDSVETITKPGYYTVEATIDGCVLKDSVLVIDPSVWSGLVADTLACKDTKGIQLKVGIEGKYEWSTGDATQSIIVKQPDTYSVTVTNSCSTYVYTSRVDFEECGCRFYSPTAFSPNDDNANDTFKPIIDCKKRAVSSYKLSIFNRQGEQVYFTQNIENTWDGTFRGQACASGVFVWLVEYAYEEKGIIKSIIQGGDVTLVK